MARAGNWKGRAFAEVHRPWMPVAKAIREARHRLSSLGESGWIRTTLPRCLLLGFVSSFALVYGPLVHLRQDRFGSFSFDMAIFDQATWLIAQGDRLFMSIRGLDVLGHHANMGLWLVAPFYRLGAGPHFLNAMQVGSLALGAIPVFLIARERLKNE
jgi:uncharacterized membrane protein